MTDFIITATIIYMAIFIIAVFYSVKEIARQKNLKQSHGREAIDEALQEVKMEHIVSIFGRSFEKEKPNKRDRKVTSVTPIKNWLPDKYIPLNMVTDEKRLQP